MSRLTGESPAVAEDRHADARDQMRREGVVWLAYASAGRHLIRLSVPSLLVFLPLGLLAVPALLFVVDESSAAVVNGSFELIGSPGTPLLVWSAAVLVASVAGQAVALPATVMLAAGRLVGKDVSVSGAMRAAARRWPAMVALVLRGVVVIAAVIAVGFILVEVEEQVAAYLVMAVLALLAMPCLLAVAVVVLESRSAKGALARAYRLAGGATWGTAFTLAFGVVLFPALATQAVNWAASGTPIVGAGAASVVALVAVPFQGAVIARLFLHRLVVKERSAEFEEIVDGLPEGGPRPARPVPVLAGLLLPGLLYGSAVLVNPLDLLEVSERVITENRSRAPGYEASQEDGRSEPTLDGSELQALYAVQGGHMVMLMDDSGEAKLLTCADSSCARTRLTWAEPAAVDGEYTAVSARLADGRLAVTTWAVDEMYRWVWDENWRARLGLMICDATACVPAPGGKPLVEVTEATRNRVLALAPRPGGGLLVAQLHPIPWGEDAYKEVLSITTCDDPACTRRHTKEVAKLPVNPETEIMRELVAGVGPDDRPVVLGVDRHTSSMVVISCDDPACARTQRGRPVQDDSLDYYSDRGRRARAAMAIRADGRPLIAYRDVTDGAIKLLDCHTRACSQAGTATLTDPGQSNSGPALVLGRDGRALVAFQDLDREQIFIAACTGTRCTRSPVTRIRRGGGHGLTMALDGQGRPMLAWIDFAGEDDIPGRDDWDLVVTTPLNLR